MIFFSSLRRILLFVLTTLIVSDIFDEYEGDIYIIYPNSESLVGFLTIDKPETIVYYLEKNQQPIHTIKQNNFDLFKIYKIELE